MESIKVARIESCRLSNKSGSRMPGTLHLTAHHLIFAPSEGVSNSSSELWLPYPVIQSLTRLSADSVSLYRLAVQTRDFKFMRLEFDNKTICEQVFESIQELVCVASVEALYAFSYKPIIVDDKGFNGWKLYDPVEEFKRMGVGSRTKAWRFSDLNKSYEFSPTYPAILAVPTRIGDGTLIHAVKFRSRGRLPVLVYLHRTNLATITRCSQPLNGLKNSRSIQDEKLVEAIFSSSQFATDGKSSQVVYGATETNLIVDARPFANALAQKANGAGTENMDHYKANRQFLNMENIHVIRDSLNKVIEALKPPDFWSGPGLPPIDKTMLRKSNWLKHTTTLLEGALTVIKNVHINSSHVMIHCSDGWDRTAQLTSLSQLCLDPYFRTLKGFAILIEKEWLSFGHQFGDRCGHLSSEKFFIDLTVSDATTSAGAILSSVKGQFASPAHVKKTSPVFFQFLEGVWQLTQQEPTMFEFNECFLLQLHHYMLSCQYGSFLYNSEAERNTAENKLGAPTVRTMSVWDDLLASENYRKYLNSEYNSQVSETHDIGVIYPLPQKVRWWAAMFDREEDDINSVESVAHDDVHTQNHSDPSVAFAASFPDQVAVISLESKQPVLYQTYPGQANNDYSRHARQRPQTAAQGISASSSMRSLFSRFASQVQDVYTSALETQTTSLKHSGENANSSAPQLERVPHHLNTASAPPTSGVTPSSFQGEPDQIEEPAVASGSGNVSDEDILSAHVKGDLSTLRLVPANLFIEPGQELEKPVYHFNPNQDPLGVSNI